MKPLHSTAQRAALWALPIPLLGAVMQYEGLMLGMWLLLPGNLLNLFIFGVHDEWPGLGSVVIAFLPSYPVYFVAFLAIFSIAELSRNRR